MAELLTSAQMLAIETAAIASESVTGATLMERAGQGVVDAVMSEWPNLAERPGTAIVLCGPGNNGGDGFVIARLLQGIGWDVHVYLFGDADKLPPDARLNYERWSERGETHEAGEITFTDQLRDLAPDLFVDALFGTGLTRPITLASNHLGPFFDFSALWTRDAGPPTISVDMPSGVCADSGAVLGCAMRAALTVSFHSFKRGHYLMHPAQDRSGSYFCGKTVLSDIGLPHDKAESVAAAWLIDAPSMRLSKGDAALHKYTHGHALVMSGPSGKTGAARLASRAALRVGAGLVTLGVPHDALTETAAQITSIILAEVDTATELGKLLQDDRLNALCVGPGFGVERARDILPVILDAGRHLVLDADALTAIAQDDALFKAVPENTLLTPHAGEFGRLFPDLTAKIAQTPVEGPAYSRADAALDAAKRIGCTVLFKGPDTVIASPDGRISINGALYDRAAPWLATAGSGDVLAGLVTGLLARGFSPHDAAANAAWLHTEAALSFGPGLIAEDLPDELPRIFRKYGL